LHSDQGAVSDGGLLGEVKGTGDGAKYVTQRKLPG